MNYFTKIVIPIHLVHLFTFSICLHPSIFVISYLSWMIEVWMKTHLVSDKNHNIVNLQCPMANNFMSTFSAHVTTWMAYTQY
jgi:hypothetical protein